MIRLRFDLLGPAAVGLMALGCQGRSFGGPGDGSAAQVSVEAVYQAATNRQLDILFVVDDTGAAYAHAPDVDQIRCGIARHDSASQLSSP